MIYIPPSAITTTTPALPVVVSQASNTSMSSSGVPTVWPVLFTTYIWSKDGALETEAGLSKKLGSAYSTSGKSS